LDQIQTYNRVWAQDTMRVQSSDNANTARQMGRVHRGDPHGVMDQYRAPADRDMSSHPDRTLDQMDQGFQAAFRRQYGKDAQNLVSTETLHITMAPSDDDEEDRDREEEEEKGGGRRHRDSHDHHHDDDEYYEKDDDDHDRHDPVTRQYSHSHSRARRGSDEQSAQQGQRQQPNFHAARNRASSRSVRFQVAPHPDR